MKDLDEVAWLVETIRGRAKSLHAARYLSWSWSKAMVGENTMFHVNS